MLKELISDENNLDKKEEVENLNSDYGFSVVLKDVCKSFNGFHVLNNICLSIKPGESVAILGQSGTGKSVLLRIIGTLLEPDSGSVKLNGIETVGMPQVKRSKIIQKIGFLFQNSGLFDIPLWENVCFKNIHLDKNPNMEKLKKKSFEILEMLEIRKDAFYLYPSEISGGMQKRVALARILMQDPELILLDEPNSGLDPITSEKINEIIKKTQQIKKRTNITITHDIKSALGKDKIFILNKGHIIWTGTPTEFISSSLEHEYIKNFIENSTF